MAAGSLVPERRLVLPLVEGCGRWIWLSDGAKANGARAPLGLKAEGDDFG